jgi:phytoene dehydrogenase-like protein
LELGFYEDFKDQSKNMIIDLLDTTVFPGIKYNVIDQFVSTPLTIETRTGSSEGAITGWAFTNPTIPVINKLTKIAQSILTPVPDVFQAGQWSYSPSGLPISVLTGKLAADKVLKELK